MAPLKKFIAGAIPCALWKTSRPWTPARPIAGAAGRVVIATMLGHLDGTYSIAGYIEAARRGPFASIRAGGLSFRAAL